MKQTQQTRAQNETGAQPEGRGPIPDRLTCALVAVAGLLILVVAALAVDMWFARREARSETLAPGSPAPGSVATALAARSTALALQAGSAPTTAPSPIPVTPPPCVPPSDWSTYVIVAGDTLFSLGRRFGTDVETLQRVNCLDGDKIVIDQELFVPGMAAAPTTATPPPGTSQPTASAPHGLADGFLNILLLGSDRRPGSSTWRTDTMIIASVDVEGNTVRLLSIPRDLWVNIPGHGYDRINTAELWGELAQEGSGQAVVKQTIWQSLGIPIHYWVRVDFDGFVKIVDALGGIDVNVECALDDINQPAGMFHFDGEDALLYARSRFTTNDFDRNRRQRKILMALWEQGLTADIIPRLPALWRAMGGTFQTDLPLDQVMALAYVGLQLNPNRIFSDSIGPSEVEDWVTPSGASVLLPRNDKIEELLADFYGPVDLAFLERIAQTRVQVVNASSFPDADQLAATSLRWDGFQVTGTGPASGEPYTTTQVIVYNSDQDIAEVVAEEVDAEPEAIQFQPTPGGPADILVFLGPDYDPCAAQ